MTISIKSIPRVFILQTNNQTLELEDINPDLSVDDIKDLYCNSYPELINATILNKGYQNDVLTYEFQTIAGTKG